MERILVVIRMAFDQEKDNLTGTMVKSLKEIGKTEWKMAMEFGRLLKVIFMKENGLKIDSMDRVYLNITQVHTKASFWIFWSKDMANKYLSMGISIKVNISKENLMEKVDMNGRAVECIKEILRMGKGKDLAYGLIRMGQSMKDSLLMISSMVKESKFIRQDKNSLVFSAMGRK